MGPRPVPPPVDLLESGDGSRFIIIIIIIIFFIFFGPAATKIGWEKLTGVRQPYDTGCTE